VRVFSHSTVVLFIIFVRFPPSVFEAMNKVADEVVHVFDGGAL